MSPLAWSGVAVLAVLLYYRSKGSGAAPDAGLAASPATPQPAASSGSKPNPTARTGGPGAARTPSVTDKKPKVGTFGKGWY